MIERNREIKEEGIREREVRETYIEIKIKNGWMDR